MRLSQEEFDVIKHYIVDWEWVKVTYGYKKDAYHYSLTDSGLVYYSSALCLLKTTKIFDGPIIPLSELAELRKTFTTGYSGVQFITESHRFLIKIADGYALSREGAEYFYVLTRLIKCKLKSTNNSIVSRLAVITMKALALSTLAGAKILTDEVTKRQSRQNLSTRSTRKTKGGYK